MDSMNLLDFGSLDAFTTTRSPERIERDALEAAKSKAAARAYQSALNNGATAREAKLAARKAAATFTR